MKKSLQDSREPSTPEAFRYKTKYVVLKFLGLSNNGSSFGSSQSGSSNDLSPNSSVLANYQSSRSISHNSEESWSWKSGTRSHSSESSGRLHTSADSGLLKEFRSFSQPQSHSDSGEFIHQVQKTSKSVQLTPNSSFSSESSLNISGQLNDLGDEDVCSDKPKKERIQWGGGRRRRGKPSTDTQGEAFPTFDLPSLDNLPNTQGDFDNLPTDFILGDEAHAGSIPLGHRDSADTIEATDPDDLAELRGRSSRQDVIPSDSYESVDTLLGEGSCDDGEVPVDVFDSVRLKSVESEGFDVDLDSEMFATRADDSDSEDSELLPVYVREPSVREVDIGTRDVDSRNSDNGIDDVDSLRLGSPLQPLPRIGNQERVASDASTKFSAQGASMRPDSLSIPESPGARARSRRYSINTAVNYLQDDLSEAFTVFQGELEEASRTQPIPPTPDDLFPESPASNVAQVLGAIGDQVNQEYAHILEQASHRVLSQPTELVAYNDFRDTAVQILETTNEVADSNTRVWYQTGLLLCFSKRVAVSMIQHGGRGLGRLADYTTRAIEDTLANYIISEGGWNSVGELNISSSPLGSSMSLSAHTPSPTSDHGPFFDTDVSSASASSDRQHEQTKEVTDNRDSVDLSVTRSETAIFTAQVTEVCMNDLESEGQGHGDNLEGQGQIGVVIQESGEFEVQRSNWRESGENEFVGGPEYVSLTETMPVGEKGDGTESTSEDKDGLCGDEESVEQSSINRYLGYVQAGMSVLALSASVAMSIVRRQ